LSATPMNFLAESSSALVILPAKCLNVPRGRNPHCGIAVLWMDRRTLMHSRVDEFPANPSLARRALRRSPPPHALAFSRLSTDCRHVPCSRGRGPAICLLIFTSDSATATQDHIGSLTRPLVNWRPRPALAREMRQARCDRSPFDLLLMPEACRPFATSRATKTYKGI
jgi:hypothetical protein